MAKELAPNLTFGERLRQRVMRFIGVDVARSSISLAPEARPYVPYPDEVWSERGVEGWAVFDPEPIVLVRKGEVPPVSPVLTARGWKSGMGDFVPGHSSTPVRQEGGYAPVPHLADQAVSGEFDDPMAWKRQATLGDFIPEPHGTSPDALGVRPDPQDWGTIAAPRR